MNIDWTQYDKACADRERDWALQDQVLYDLCKRHPLHGRPGDVKAKLSIVGRSYSTGIERQIKSTGVQSSSLGQLAQHFLRNHRTVDAIFGRLHATQEPLTPAKLREILSVHGELTAFVASILRKGRTPRSFVSKYMHFHCSAVPIYDSLSSASLRALCQWEDHFLIFELPHGTDEEYAWHALRFWQLYQNARQARENVTVKRLDRFILFLREKHETEELPA